MNRRLTPVATIVIALLYLLATQIGPGRSIHASVPAKLEGRGFALSDRSGVVIMATRELSKLPAHRVLFFLHSGGER